MDASEKKYDENSENMSKETMQLFNKEFPSKIPTQSKLEKFCSQNDVSMHTIRNEIYARSLKDSIDIDYSIKEELESFKEEGSKYARLHTSEEPLLVSHHVLAHSKVIVLNSHCPSLKELETFDSIIIYGGD